MAKFTLFLCFLVAGAFFAPSIEAGWVDTLSDTATKILDEISKITRQAIESVEGRVEQALETCAEYVESLKKSATDMITEAHDTVTDAMKELDKKLDEITGRAPGVDVTECTKMADGVRNTAYSIIANTTACVTDKVDTANGYVQHIISTSQDLLQELYDIQERASHCTEGDGYFKAVSCLGAALKDATVAAATKVPTYIADLTKLTFLVSTVMPSLTICSAARSVSTLWENADDVLQKVEACIEQKLEEIQDVTTEPPY